MPLPQNEGTEDQVRIMQDAMQTVTDAYWSGEKVALGVKPRKESEVHALFAIIDTLHGMASASNDVSLPAVVSAKLGNLAEDFSQYLQEHYSNGGKKG